MPECALGTHGRPCRESPWRQDHALLHMYSARRGDTRLRGSDSSGAWRQVGLCLLRPAWGAAPASLLPYTGLGHLGIPSVGQESRPPALVILRLQTQRPVAVRGEGSALVLTCPWRWPLGAVAQRQLFPSMARRGARRSPKCRRPPQGTWAPASVTPGQRSSWRVAPGHLEHARKEALLPPCVHIPSTRVPAVARSVPGQTGGIEPGALGLGMSVPLVTGGRPVPAPHCL